MARTWSNIQDVVVTASSYTTSVTISWNITDILTITAQNGPLLFNNILGQLYDGKTLMIEIRDNGTPQSLTYDTMFASGASTLITTTVAWKWSWMKLKYNVTDAKLYCLASWTQP